jgi:hypothetical protein
MNWKRWSKRIGSIIADRYQAAAMGLAQAAMVIPAASSQLQPTPKRMVAVSVPPHVDAVHHTANVKLHLDAGALPTTFKVTTNGGRNVTQKFNVSGCSSVPCDVTATFLGLFAKRRVYGFRVDPKFGVPTKAGGGDQSCGKLDE